MKQIDYIYDLIDKSDITLIGYTYKVEKQKMNLFPNYLVLNLVK